MSCQLRSTACRRHAPAAAAVLLALAAARCGEPAQPVATVAASVNRSAVPLGGPVELSLRFAAAPNLEPLEGHYRVFVHFLDSNGNLMWTDDHDPPAPPSTWRPGQIVSYTRTVTVPEYPYVGEATIGVGLHSPASGERLALAGEDLGQRIYRGAVLALEPQAESSFLRYVDGWYDSEYDPDSSRQWRWTSERAGFVFRNPRSEAVLYLRLAGQPDQIPDGRQRVAVRAGDHLLREIVLDSTAPEFEAVVVQAEQLGGSENSRIDLHVSPTFVPSEVRPGANRDDRRLGVRVDNAFLEAR